MRFSRVTTDLNSADILIIAFLLFLSLVEMVFATRIPYWWQMVAINGAAILVIGLLGHMRKVTGSRILGVVHDWHVAPTVFFTFKELYFIIQPLHGGRDYDDVLIAADRWLFGGDPTHWLMNIRCPVVTEILQIAYTLFYALFVLVGWELYRSDDKRMFHYFMFACVYGFYLSYAGYFLLPAIGPRFTLHSFAALDKDLPGLFLTPYLRWFVNFGGSVPMGVPDSVAIAGTQRDVFPSGHTMMTLVVMYFCLRYRFRVRWFVVITGVLLILATVYERYHYVVDLVGGAVFAVICTTTTPALYRLIRNRFSTTDGS